ncbi:MAG: pyocin knob domain-containing protein [Oscillospiraceae bacterium]|nr:pyocin knob domain-containing protein [Oscillospiraceae bacterium]
MANRVITATVQSEYIKLSSRIAGAAGSHNAVTLEISFDSEWDGTSRKIYFISADGKNACITLTTDLLVSGETDKYNVEIPSEGLASAGEMTLTVKGYHIPDGETVADRVIMSASARMTVLCSDKPDADNEPADVTTAQAEQLQGEIDTIKTTIINAETAATNAAASATAAAQSAANASTAETNSAASAAAASTSKTAAQTAQTAAENAKADAEAAQTAAESAKTASQAAQSAAETAKVAAEAAEVNASASATSASDSASTATSKATAAAASATAAAASEDNALTYKNAAANSASASAASSASATTSMNAAASSAQAAATAKAAAESAQTAADTAKTAAEAAQSAAETAKTAAEIAQGNAETAETNAVTAKTAAQTAQSLAETAKTAAQGAATAAQAAQAAAEAAKTGAETSEANAGASADESEAWACGTIGGVAVPSTHAAYHNNSKYYKDLAEAIVGGDYATKVEAQGYVDTHNAAADAHSTLFAAKLGTSGDGSNVTAAFTEAAARENISTGEKLSVLFGKIKKWFSSLGSAAFTDATAYDASGAASGAVSTHNSASDAHSTLFAAKANTSALSAHAGATNNPHGVTKTQVGLGNADNTADANKPVSTAQQAALDNKADKSKMFYPDNQYGGIITDNFNTISVSGFYTGYGTATGAPNTASSWYVLHINSNSGTSYGFQIAKAYGTASGLYYRVKSSGTWGAWGFCPASDIGVTDSGGYFTASTVEAVLQEIGANKQDKITASGLLKGAGNGNVSVAARGTDYSLVNAPVIVSVPYTGWVKNATTNAYEQSVAVTGLLTTDDKRTRVEVVGSTDVAAQALIDTAAALISYVACNTNGYLYLRCDSGAPATTFSAAVVIER